MPNIVSSTSTLACGFLLVTAGVGVSGLERTPLSIGGQSVWGGSYQRAVEDGFTRNLPFREISIELWTALNLSAFGQVGDKVVVAGRDWLFTAEEFSDTPPGYDFQTELDHARNAVQAIGAELVPVIIPDKARVYADLLPMDRGGRIEARHAAALDVLKRNGFATIDLSHALTQARADAPTYMRTDTHWSPSGARTAAHVIAGTLRLATPANNPFTTTHGPVQEFDGDLMSFVPIGSFRSSLGPKHETISIPETSGAGGADLLFGDMATPIALVGTSYSARVEFNFAGFLQQETGLDLVNHAVEGQGPFAPMRDLLASGSLADSQPEIVIWEIPERYVEISQ